MTPTITRLCPRSTMNHILASPPKNTSSIREAANLFLLCEHFKTVGKGQAVHGTYTSGDVSNSFYGSQLGQEWEIYICAGLDYELCVCVGQTHPEWSRSAAFVKYDLRNDVPCCSSCVTSVNLISSKLPNSIFNPTPRIRNQFPQQLGLLAE